MGLLHRTRTIWAGFWMFFSGTSPWGRFATWLATWHAAPYFGRLHLSRFNPRGYISPSAKIYHKNIVFGPNIFIDDRVLFYHDIDGGAVIIGERVQIYRDTIVQNGYGGSVKIGTDTRIHPRCIISAYLSSIEIGCNVGIAANCTFYSYNHGIAAGDVKIIRQPLQTKGGIVIEDGAWLGVGVTVLDGVRIGKGAVVGAGSVVIKDVPEGAVVMGVPACIVKMRDL